MTGLNELLSPEQRFVLAKWLKANDLGNVVEYTKDLKNGARIFARPENTNEPWEIDFCFSKKNIPMTYFIEAVTGIKAKEEE